MSNQDSTTPETKGNSPAAHAESADGHQERIADVGEPLTPGLPQNRIGKTADCLWHSAAGELTAWTECRLVNRTDVWGAYTSQEYRATGKGKNYTAPRTDQRGKVLLTGETIKRHYQGCDEGHLLGLHAIGTGNMSRWVVIDIDKHGDDDPADAQTNFAAAEKWHEDLNEIGFNPLLLDSNGDGGFHLLVVFANPVPSEKAYGFGRWIIRDYADQGLHQLPESFPKQPCLNEGRRYGSWWRLPGRHHTRHHWTRVWNGTRWLEGRPAIDAILSVAGDPPALLSDSLRPAPALAHAGSQSSRLPTTTKHDVDDWLALLSGCEPGGRHNALTQLAGYLLRLQVPLAIAEELCVVWNEARNHPPRTEDHVRSVVRDIQSRYFGEGTVSVPSDAPRCIQRAYRRLNLKTKGR